MGKKNYDIHVKYFLSSNQYDNRHSVFGSLENSAEEFFNLFDARGANNFIFLMNNLSTDKKDNPIIEVFPERDSEIRCLVPRFSSPLKVLHPVNESYSPYSTDNFTFKVSRTSGPSGSLDKYFTAESKIFLPKDL